MKPSATFDNTLIEQNRSKLEADILPTDEGHVSSVETHKAINTYIALFTGLCVYYVGYKDITQRKPHDTSCITLKFIHASMYPPPPG